MAISDGTFTNVFIKSFVLLPACADGSPPEGGFLLFQTAGTPTVVFAIEEHGTGSNREGAAKGTQSLGYAVKV